jgi:hypothetical protein
VCSRVCSKETHVVKYVVKCVADSRRKVCSKETHVVKYVVKCAVDSRSKVRSKARSKV